MLHTKKPCCASEAPCLPFSPLAKNTMEMFCTVWYPQAEIRAGSIVLSASSVFSTCSSNEISANEQPSSGARRQPCLNKVGSSSLLSACIQTRNVFIQSSAIQKKNSGNLSSTLNLSIPFLQGWLFGLDWFYLFIYLFVIFFIFPPFSFFCFFFPLEG